MDLNWIFDILASPYMALFCLPLIGYCCWHNVYDYNDLAECVAVIDANEATIFITNPQDITENLTIPVNITLRFIQGGSLNVSAGITVTINGQVEAGGYQIFEGAGTATVNTYPQQEAWWGNPQQFDFGDSDVLARNMIDLPGIIADVLSDHDKAAHDALDIDAGTVDGEEAAAIVTEARVGAVLTKAIVDALAINADQVDGVEGAEILQRDGSVSLTANWNAGWNITMNMLQVGLGGNLRIGNGAGVLRLVYDANEVAKILGVSNAIAGLKISKAIIGAFELNTLIANNKVPDSDLVDGEEAADIVTKARVDAVGPSHDSLVDVSIDDHHPQVHYHVGKDIVSLQLVDLDDIEADDIFDVLPTAAIDGEGNYDWWGTWDTTAAANTSAEVVVLAGVDKYLRLTDNNNGDIVETELVASAGHPLVTGVIQFDVRISAKVDATLSLMKAGAGNMAFKIIDDGIGNRKFWFHNGTADVELLAAYNVNQWYTIRIHFDCVARAAVVFVDNVFVLRTALNAGAVCDYVDTIKVHTDPLSTGYTFDINNLKVFNLTI